MPFTAPADPPRPLPPEVEARVQQAVEAFRARVASYGFVVKQMAEANGWITDYEREVRAVAWAAIDWAGL